MVSFLCRVAFQLQPRLGQAHGVVEFLLQQFLRRQLGQVFAHAEAALGQLKQFDALV